MPALLSFDCEFSHPVPSVGALLQFGAVCVPWDPEKLAVVKHETPGLKLKLLFPITDDHVVSDWVRKNQAPLLERSRALAVRNQMAFEDCKEALVAFLDRATSLYEAPIIPAGWCLGSDMAFLLHVLGEDNEKVHYSAVDLKGLVMALFGSYDPGDKEVAAALGVGPPENEHDALADAEYQMKLLLAAFKRIRERAL